MIASPTTTNARDPRMHDAINVAKSGGLMELLAVAASAAPDDCENGSNINDAAKTRRIKRTHFFEMATNYAANALRSSKADADLLRRAADYDDKHHIGFMQKTSLGLQGSRRAALKGRRR